MSKENFISPKDLAKLLGISTATVNYYTNIGLFKIKDRRGNVRLYDRAEVLGMFEKIRKLRKDGYSLRLIQQRLDKGYSL